MSIMVYIDHQLKLERNLPLILCGFLYSSEVDHNVLLPEMDGNVNSLKSLDCLEMNGVQSKGNSLGSIKHIKVEPPVPKSQLTCRCYSNTIICILISRFSVNDKKANKTSYSVLFSG